MLGLQVKDFGPIIEGDIRLRPLTIFIGPNNSGKSYLAVLAYALFSINYYPLLHRGRIQRLAPLLALPFRTPEQLLDDLSKWLREREGEIGEGEAEITIAELPQKIRDGINEFVDSSTKGFASAFSDQLRRCFGSHITDLARKGRTAGGFSLLVSQDEPRLQIAFSSSNDKIKSEVKEFDIQNIRLKFPPISVLKKAKEANRAWIFEILISSLLPYRELYQHFKGSLYLPAARSGILQSHKALVSGVMRQLPLLGIEPLEIPRLSGVIGDFISSIILLEKRRRTRLYNIAEFLEKNITVGSVDIKAGKLEYPEIFYKSEVGEFPLYRTSSMISELAPVILFLKYIVEPNELLIIEEPESHLHPAAQRKLAWGIAKLIRAGLKLLITTHSDYFLSQISNFILLGQASEEDRVEAGYSEDDYLRAGEVGVYLFRFDPAEGGSFVKELEVTAEDGIPEDEFVEVAAQLGSEAARLERLISRKTS